jgi:hypothetical protein
MIPLISPDVKPLGIVVLPGRAHNGSTGTRENCLHFPFGLQPEIALAARPTIQAKPPNTAKNTTAIQASES